ncbi:MAG: hypothetical protein EOO77_38250 [Oxalobacteraceae bacterium]|nr:MAG: hypothetical protein EOO77_38250 [Oxalobacteraceae bacterium]
MTEPPSAEPDRTPSYRAVVLDAYGGEVLNTPISAAGDDEAKGKARALVDGHALDLWDGLRFIERFEPVDPLP